jgi:FSR family fosmidomycin resistance protein-like MFS transporter
MSPGIWGIDGMNSLYPSTYSKGFMGNTFVYCAKFLITLYTSILVPLLPLLMVKMHLSLMLAASLISIFSLFNSLLQPLFGWIEDRINYNFFLVFGPPWVGIFIGAIGISSNYAWLILCLILAGIGISAFHPAAFGYVGKMNPNRRSIAISFLIMADALGFIVGPIAISLFVSFFGIEKLYLCAIPGVIITFALWKVISAGREEIIREPVDVFRQFQEMLIRLAPLFILTLSITIISINLFSLTPFFLKERGVSITMVGFFLSSFAFGSALGPMIGSLLTRKMGRVKVIRVSMILSICFVLVFLLAQSVSVQIIFFFLSGLSLMGPFSIIIDMGQEMFPKYLSTTSTLLNGFTWGIGGLLVVVTAKVAETLGIVSALMCLIIFPIANLLIAYFAWSTHWFQRFNRR